MKTILASLMLVLGLAISATAAGGWYIGEGVKVNTVLVGNTNIVDIINGAVAPYTNRIENALTNPPNLQTVVNQGGGAVSNAPYLVQTNATDVTFAGFRFQGGGALNYLGFQGDAGFIGESNASPYVIWWNKTQRALSGTGSVGTVATFYDVFRVGPTATPVETTLTNHTAQLNFPVEIWTNPPTASSVVTNGGTASLTSLTVSSIGFSSMTSAGSNAVRGVMIEPGTATTNLTFWTGTAAAYAALSVTNPACLYFVY